MAKETDGLLLTASLNIEETANIIKKEDIAKLNAKLANDDTARVKIVGGLDLSKTQSLIQSQIATISKNLKLNIGQVDTNNLTTTISNNFKNIQTQAKNTSNIINDSFANITLKTLPNDAVKSYQSIFGVAKNVTNELKNLFVEFNNAWYTGDLEKYNQALKQIYELTLKNSAAGKQLTRTNKEAIELIDRYRSELTDGSKVYITPQVRTELEALIGKGRELQSVLSTVFGAGNWSYKSGTPLDVLDVIVNDSNGLNNFASKIIDVYNNIKAIKSEIVNPLYDDKDGISIIENEARAVLQLKNEYTDASGAKKTFIDGMGWFEEVTSDVNKATAEYKDFGKKVKQSAEETQTATKATIETTSKEIQAINAQIEAYDNLTLSKKTALTTASGEQISRTETFTNKSNGKSKTVIYDEEDNESVIRYAENIDKVVAAQERANASAIKLETSYAKIKSRIEDLNSSKPIKDDGNKSKLTEQYNKVEQAIKAVENADSSNLTTMKANAEKEISALQNLERAYRNAENTAEQLRARDVTTIKTENIQKLAQFEAKIQGSKVPISEMRNDLDDLNVTINKIGNNDTEGLTKFLNQFDIAKAKFAALNQQLTTDNSMQKQAQNAELLVEKVKKLRSEIIAYQNANSKAMKSNATSSNGITYSAEIDSLLTKLKNASSVTDAEFKKISASFRSLKAEVKSAELEGGTIFSNLWASIKKFSSWMSMTSVISTVVMDVRNAVVELKEIDTILTEISKTSDRTTESLDNLGKTAFDTASKFGQKANDYLTGIQEMSRAGFEGVKSENMAELSTLAQSAGDMTADLANSYLIATNAAYKLDGNISKLNSVLDGQNLITNKNALNMRDLAEGTSIVASQAANAGIGADQLTAALGTMIATTQQSGSEMANAFKGILINLQQIKGYTDEETGETFDAEKLTKYEKACEAMGVSLKEMKDGILQLRDPMQILEDLANKYKELDSSSTLRANLLSSIGGKYRANALDSLLSNWDTYKKMLSEFNSDEAVGSAAKEAQKTAESWEGMFNALENDWTKFVNEFANSDLFKSLIESARRFVDVLSDASFPLNFILTQVANLIELASKLADKIGLIPTILGGLSLKNVGELKS